MLDLDTKEIQAFEKLMTRSGHDVEESGGFIGHYVQMKMFGVMAFRITHSHPVWMKTKAVI